MSDDKKADARMAQIISAIKNKDKEALKSLFSKKAIDEADDFNAAMDSFFDFIHGDIKSWKSDDGCSSDESIGGGKKSLMIRSGFTVITDEAEYSFFVIDYNEDTINPENQGVYMLEVATSGNKYKDSWQDRMRAGFSILQQ